jgi:ABC-type nickel/cobalt efflux system permease component RcnA
MQTLISIQQWLYGGIGQGLGDVAGGNASAVLLAMAAAVLFGAVHALMPGHGKTSVGGGRLQKSLCAAPLPHRERET